MGWTERARENYRGTKKKSARAAHKLYTVKRGAVRLLPKYAQRTGMQHGALGTQNKDSTVSGSLSPVLPHPHIINWKIPDICCNPPPYSSCWCWYRLGFKIQVTGACAHVIHTYQSVASFSAPAGLPRHRQQLIQQCAEVRKCVRLHVCVCVCAHACVCVGREWGGVGSLIIYVCVCQCVCVKPCECLLMSN